MEEKIKNKETFCIELFSGFCKLEKRREPHKKTKEMHRVSVREQTHGNNNKWESLSLNKIIIILLYIFSYLIHNYTFLYLKIRY